MDNYELKLLCSYGGKIQQLPQEKQLSYVDGDTKIFYVNRIISLSAMLHKLSSICKEQVSEFKYQFPESKNEVILVTVNDDNDLENMMREYDKLYNDILHSDNSLADPIMRLFVSPPDRCGYEDDY